MRFSEGRTRHEKRQPERLSIGYSQRIVYLDFCVPIAYSAPSPFGLELFLLRLLGGVGACPQSFIVAFAALSLFGFRVLLAHDVLQ